MMKRTIFFTSCFCFVFLALGLPLVHSQSKGVKTITGQELKYHLDFLGAREFRGRETPSHELEIATVYIGNWALHNGLKPLLKDGSFYQEVPVTVNAVSVPNTRIRVTGKGSETVYYFGKSFGGNFTTGGTYSGSIVFAGTGSDQETGDHDLRNKIVVLIDDVSPSVNIKQSPYLTSRMSERVTRLREKGASAVFSIVSPEKQQRISSPSGFYDYIPTGRLGTKYDSQKTSFANTSNDPSQQTRPQIPFTLAEINHAMAAGLLGVTETEIAGYFSAVRAGNQLSFREYPEIFAKLDVELETYRASSRNVIAVVEGSDPVLKNEYVVICGHHDGRGIDDGEIIPAADDNGTAAVALIEIGQALLTDRPKRSVILAWVTGEEQGMNGSHYFINNCPVPPEKISACLDMDMLGRNNPDSLFLVASDLLSTELDGAIKKANKNPALNFGFDYRYSNLTHPQRVYFRSDHYPFIRFGIPSVWFFCGFTDDYHTYRDACEYIDYTKFLKVTKLVYLTAMEIGNMKSLLRLDVNPAVNSRGAHNLRETSLFQAK